MYTCSIDQYSIYIYVYIHILLYIVCIYSTQKNIALDIMYKSILCVPTYFHACRMLVSTLIHSAQVQTASAFRVLQA